MPVWTPHDRIAEALKASAAPRFLVHLFALDIGEYTIHVDAPELAESERAGTLIVALDEPTGERRAHLRYSRFADDARAAEAGLAPVYAHYETFNDSLWVSYSEDDSPPEFRGQSFRLRDVLESNLVIEDMCDFLALDLDRQRIGKAPSAAYRLDGPPIVIF